MVIKKRTAGLRFLSGRRGLIRNVLIAGLGLLSVFVLIGGGLAAWAVGPIVAGAPSPYEGICQRSRQTGLGSCVPEQDAGYAAAMMARTVTVRRRWISRRRSAGTCSRQRERARRKDRSSS